MILSMNKDINKISLCHWLAIGGYDLVTESDINISDSVIIGDVQQNIIQVFNQIHVSFIKYQWKYNN